MSFVEEEENVSGEVNTLRSYCLSKKSEAHTGKVPLGHGRRRLQRMVNSPFLSKP